MHEELLARPQRLTDALLLSETRSLVARERDLTARLVVHLAEVERRTLHLKQGYSSMFDYCRRGLGLSEHEAYGRIEAARVVRHFPVLIDYLIANRITFTVVGVIGRHLNEENHLRLLDRACGLTKEQAKELVASVAPKPDAATRLVRLPTPDAPPDPPSASLPFGAVVPPTGSRPLVTAPAGIPLDNPDRQVSGASKPTSGAPPDARPAPKPAAPETRPLSPDRYLYRVTVDRETRDLLVQARELLGHAVPDKDDGELLKRALRLLVDETMRRKFATRLADNRTRADRVTAGNAAASSGDATASNATASDATASDATASDATASDATASDATASDATASDGAATAHTSGGQPRPGSEHAWSPGPDSRHIPAAVKRAVFARDEGRCAYVGSEGVRCDQKSRIEFHHVRPWGIGGATSVDNVQLRCQRHNLLEARLFYAREDVPPRELRAP